MKDGLHVVDSDLHVIEGEAAFARHLDARYRDRAPQYMGWGPTNFPWWTVEGQPIPPWAESEAVIGPQRFLDAPVEATYREVKRRGYDPESALDAMDQEGIDMAIVFRTFAHMVVSIDALEPDYAMALCAAFNDWLSDYCGTSPRRLKAAAILSLHDPELAAQEARRAVEQRGHVAVVLLPMPVNGRSPHASECDVLWAEVQRLGVPICFHGTSGGASRDYISNRFVGHPNYRTLNHAAAFPLELMTAMGGMLVGGVVARFPQLKVAFLEGNCGWLPWWLRRLDDQWKKYGGGETLQLEALPSEYFKRQCFIGTDVDEELLRVVVDEIGDDNIVVSTDYPHADGPFPHGIDEFLELPGVSRESKRKILWDNCARLYNLRAPTEAA